MKTYPIVMLFAAAVGSFAQELLPSKYQLPAGGISHIAAAAKARAFLALVGDDAGDVRHYKAVLQRRPAHRNEVEWRVYTGQSVIKVDALTSRVNMYTNQKRQDDRFRGKGRTGEKFVRTDVEAKAHLRKLAERLGVPSSAALSGFNLKGDGVGQDSNPLGEFGGTFKNPAGQIVAILSCDLQDGDLIKYLRERKE